MSKPDVKINIDTNVTNQKEVTKLSKEILKLGQTSASVDEQVDNLTDSMNDLTEATKLRDRLEDNNNEVVRTTAELENAQKALSDTKDELASFNENADSKKINELNLSISDQEKGLKRLENAQARAQKKYDDTNRSVEQSSDSVKRLVRESDHYIDSTKKATQAQEKLIAEMEGLKDVGEAYAKLNVKDLEKEIEELEKSYKTLENSGILSAEELKIAHKNLTEEVNKHQKALNGTDQAYKDLKKGALQFAPVAEALYKIMQSTIEYEDAMVGLRKVANGTAEEINQLEKNILDLSLKIPMSAVELAKMAEQGARAGKSANELTGFIELSAKAAGAFNITAEEAGNNIATLGAVFGGTAKDTEELMEAINMLDDSVNATAPDITTVINGIGDIGQTAGYSGQQLSVMAASLLETGNTASKTTTALENTLNGLANIKNGTADAQKSLEKLGFSSVEFAQLLRDNPEKALISFLEQLNKLDKQSQIDITSKMFGSVAQSQVIQMAMNVDRLSGMFKQVGDYASYAGGMTDQLNLANESTSAQIQFLKNNINAMSIDLGNKLLPALNSMMKAAIDIIEVGKIFAEQYPLITEFGIGLVIAASSAKLLGASMKLLGLNIVGAGAKLAGFTANLLISKNMMTASQVAATRLTLALGTIGIALVAATKWWDAYNERQKANLAEQEALTEASKVAQEYAKRGIQLNKDGSISIDRKKVATMADTEATKANTEATKENSEEEKKRLDDIEQLRGSLDKLGIDYDLVTNNISSANRAQVESFQDVSRNSQATAGVIMQSFSKVLSQVDTAEEFNLLTNALKEIEEQGKISAWSMYEYREVLDELTLSVQQGTISDEEFRAKKAELVEMINAEASSFSTANSEIAKRIELINIQLEQEKQLANSVIKKLEAERVLAIQRGETYKAEQLALQIKQQQIALMDEETRLMMKLLEEHKKELQTLLKKKEVNGELTQQDQERVRALQNLIQIQENEIEATLNAAEAKKIDAHMAEQGATSLDKMAQSSRDLAAANREAAQSSREFSGSFQELGSRVDETQIRTVQHTSWLGDMADQSLMSKKALEELIESVKELNRNFGRGSNDKLKNSIANEINRFEELQRKIENSNNYTEAQLKAWERMAKGFNYVNEEAVNSLRQNLDNMRQEIDRQHEELINRNKSLRDQLMDLQADDDELKREREQAADIKNIREAMLEAEKEGDKKKVEALQEQLFLTSQIHAEQNRKVDKEKAEQERTQKVEVKETLDINIDGHNVIDIDPGNAIFIKQVSKAVVDFILRQRESSTKYRAQHGVVGRR